MKNPRALLFSGTFWLLSSQVLISLGVGIGVLAVMAAGLSSSGSGCGKDCFERISSMAFAGNACFVVAIIAALVSSVVAWVYQRKRFKTWIRIGITLLNVLQVAMAGGGIAFLRAF